MATFDELERGQYVVVVIDGLDWHSLTDVTVGASPAEITIKTTR